MKSLDKSKNSISTMFNSIAPKYDFIGHFFSFGIDKYWRKKTINSISIKPDFICLDVATGTGDMVFYLAEKKPYSIVGIDISKSMLDIAEKKYKKKHLATKISFLNADAEHIPFPDETFDVVTIAFGVRNFNDPIKALIEIKRVLKKNGSLNIIELTIPANFFGKFYKFYLSKIMPFGANCISRKAKVYNYLPKSIVQFNQGDGFIKLMNNCGFLHAQYSSLSMGIATLYKGFMSQPKMSEFSMDENFERLIERYNKDEQKSFNVLN